MIDPIIEGFEIVSNATERFGDRQLKFCRASAVRENGYIMFSKVKFKLMVLNVL